MAMTWWNALSEETDALWDLSTLHMQEGYYTRHSTNVILMDSTNNIVDFNAQSINLLCAFSWIVLNLLFYYCYCIVMFSPAPILGQG